MKDENWIFPGQTLPELQAELKARFREHVAQTGRWLFCSTASLKSNFRLGI